MPEESPSSRVAFKIVVRKVERPFSRSVERELDWICQSLGFFEPIDRDKTAAALFKEVVQATEKGKALSSTALAKRVGMSRGSAVNHLNRLQRSGLVVRDGRRYFARSRSVFRTIEEIEDDIERVFQRMKETARQIDREFGIETEE
ncbi:MAG: helix-turn-helix domain-containing protein [Candidatus Diapherotrites archaeon]|nr:helix-turn-helix domain-containing protein [Candidatus Diapherotrites archaeon]